MSPSKSLTAQPPARLSKLPPEMKEALLHRGEWSFCAMDHSRHGPIEFDAPGAPFHHLALPIERVPIKFGLKVDGRQQVGRNAPNALTMIEAGAGGTMRWDETYESACLYFTTRSLSAALGRDLDEQAHAVRTAVVLHAPRMVRLLGALYADAEAGQPHGSLIGDAVFVALAAQLVAVGDHHRAPPRASGEAARVKRAIEYIQASLTDRLDIASIAAAAATSPFYLNHAFRSVLGCSIWQYVLRERARYAFHILRDLRFNLAEVSLLAGFETYASFIASIRREYDNSPSGLRRALES
ncbi:AraC family transcriptional regulator [Sphingomonas koreensis]|nr:AraC family transcriptional regulator [Sphingomonas koreensis]